MPVTKKKRVKGDIREAAKLRRRAEGRLDNKERTRLPHRAVAPQGERLVHELDVHKIELELQNEELRLGSETLEASLAQYAELYDFAPVGYFTLDRSGTIQQLNLTGARLLGLERAHLVGRPFETFVARGDRPALRAFLGEVFGGVGQATCEVSIEPRGSGDAAAHPHAHAIHVRVAATIADNKKECRALAMDVTDQTNAVRALRESELRFRTLVESMEDSVITTDRRGCTTSVRSKLLERLGIQTATFVGKTAPEIYGGEVGARHEAAHARVLAGEPVVYEWTHELGRHRFQMQTVASPLRDAEGHITGSLDVSRDLTELKKLHEQVMLADRMSSLGILAAGIAHEINNPLAVVIANLDAALDQLRRAQKSTAPAPPFPPETLEMLDDCLESADRVRQIVGDLKVFSRADENKRALVDLPRVVRASLKLVKNEIRHRATLITDFGDVPAVLGNEARLGQVFLNLLVNAAQSVPEGNVARHTITVRTLTHPSGCAVVEVRDTGLGITPEALAHIFEPFFTTKPIGVGTGLGLAICRQIVTGVGGEITVDSEVGAGTVFRVLLPAAIDQTLEIVAPQPSQQQAPPPSQTSGRRGRILLIDDDPEVLKTTARTLAGRHEVIALLRARDALDLITAGENFDLVISDLMMPEMTGMDLHGALSAIAPQHAKRMIFLTGGAFTPRARGFLRQVDNPRLDKPFDRQNLIGLVDSVLE